ncbi:MAG: hypothetical protein ACTHNU_16150 [Gaiellales bacterium]
MRHRVLIGGLVALALTAASSAPASAGALPCTQTLTKLRYRPRITYICGGASLTTVSATVVRLPAGTAVSSTAAVSGDTATVDLASLASATSYRVDVTIGDGTDSYTHEATWKTLPAPAHPKITVEYLTAVSPAAQLDMLHRVDAANLVAVPSSSHVIDVGSSPLTAAGLENALRGRQVALVVGGDESFAHPAWVGAALAWFASHGHGVVTAGQTHWQATASWPSDSALGMGTPWNTRWDVFADSDQITPDRIHGGGLLASSVVHHFITNGLLRAFTVVGPGSGEPFPHFLVGSHVLASLKHSGSGFFHTYFQALLTVRQVGSSRLVDLGYRPWASDIPGGGFDPAVSPGGALLARSLEWAANRIPPVHTRFTSKPPNPAGWATFGVSFAATDPDLDSPGALRFRYRLDGGRWRWASAYGATFYNLAKGRYHTIDVYAVDSGGNRDPHTARYRFLISPNARS